MTLNKKWLKLAGMAVMAAMPLVTRAQPTSYDSRDYRNEIDPAPQQAPSSALEQDRQDLINARHRADDLQAQRDQQQRTVDSMSNSDRSAPVAAVSVDVQSFRQQLDDAKANADKIHADAVARFESGDAWKSEFSRFDAARQDLKVPTDDVLNRVSQTPDFKALVDAARAAKEKADRLHEDKNADPQAVKEADDAFMAADSRVR